MCDAQRQVEVDQTVDDLAGGVLCRREGGRPKRDAPPGGRRSVEKRQSS
jgi:hypothetical protein